MPHSDLEVKRAYMRAYRKDYDQRDYVKQGNQEKRRLYYLGNKEKEANRMKNCRAKTLAQRERVYLIKARVLANYSNPAGVAICNNCGEKDLEVLCLDHINGEGTQQRKAIGCNTYDWVIKNEFPGGYQVLCYNCNIKKRGLDSLRKQAKNSPCIVRG